MLFKNSHISLVRIGTWVSADTDYSLYMILTVAIACRTFKYTANRSILLIGGYVMNNFDLTPLFRSTIGFDRFSQLLGNMTNSEDNAFSYPPYNIERIGEENYRITMAVAGFSEDEIQITAKENSLIVVGKSHKSEEPKQYLYRGIAGRSFERRFELADYIQVDSACIDNGLLHIELIRQVPESAKPRNIKISSVSPSFKNEKTAGQIGNQAA